MLSSSIDRGDRVLRRVLMIGAGLMGSQIAFEYALAGHDVVLAARSETRIRRAVETAAAFAGHRGVATTHQIQDAMARTRVSGLLEDALAHEFDLVVESVAEDFETKAELLGQTASVQRTAIIASNASSLSIAELGIAIGAPERTLGTHYWNPPMLMPPVEVIVTPHVAHEDVEKVEEVLRSMGKQVVRVNREVPGFVWNRLQMAVLREALWLVEQGVATPETIDLVVRSGYARRSRYTGPFETAALGGITSWQAAAANIFPTLSTAKHPGDMADRVRPISREAAETAAARRDRGLAADLARERGGAPD